MKMEVHYAINDMVDMLLPRFSHKEAAFYVCVDARFTIYGKNVDHNVSKEIHLLFQRPNNYTKVFVYETDKHVRPGEIPADAWTLKADHDSCWRDGTSTTLFNAWLGGRNQVEEQAQKAGEDKDKKVSEFVTFDAFNKPGLVKVDIKELPNPSGNGWERKFTVKVGSVIDLKGFELAE